MYLLYLDEAGTHAAARHFVLAGVAVYEQNTYWVTDELNRLQAQYFPDIRGRVRFRTAPLRTPDGTTVEAPFDELPASCRRQLLNRLYAIAQQMRGRLFAVVIEKDALAGDDDPYERALEEMTARFDRYLNRMYREHDRRNKGLIVIDDSQYRERLEAISRQFADEGTRWNKIYNVLDIPLFTSSQNSRMLQIADLIANTVYGRYERGYAIRFDPMVPKFEQSRNGAIHGLVHIRPGEATQCYLPCCLSRRLATQPNQPLNTDGRDDNGNPAVHPGQPGYGAGHCAL